MTLIDTEIYNTCVFFFGATFFMSMIVWAVWFACNMD